MKNSIILGIDPGLVNTGWGVISNSDNMFKFVACGTISTKSSDDMGYRLSIINQGLQKVIEQYQPSSSAIEDCFVNKNPLSSLKLGQAKGAAMLTVALAKIELSEYAATLVKKSLVGSGRAEKHQMMMMVKQLLPKATLANDHEADALAIAICHVNHAKLRSML